ncbi:hypothetical protein MUS1_10520 [Marinomonas ushuaiensis DSM 15871]|uniref:DUF2496 domain-containing protein n=1 Tax=Marinomonas ushuaiensis DSM 15871 TaxID=1122207 RepID=X7E594_9GAMM|nr:pleiotropic regulatory protein RsmS [Marinomonas ushuaiensis]ETX11234.1 hypothetical protein MUS1_10520 [Marinomonas ushuaiensis DSM 15871]
MSLEEAPAHVQLAVDLIELLEANEIETHIAIEALKIVLSDFEGKLNDIK